MSVVVWEWENDANIYLPYSSEVSAQLEAARNGNVKEVPLGGIDPYLETFKVNIPKMTQITAYNSRTRVVRRVFIDTAHPFARGTKWEWNFHHDHWFPYGTEVAKRIQEAVDGGTVSPAQVPGSFQLPNLLPGYMIDVRAMVQTNSRTGYQRKIRSVNCTPYQYPGSTTQPSPATPIRPTPVNYPPAPPAPRVALQPAPQPSAPQRPGAGTAGAGVPPANNYPPAQPAQPARRVALQPAPQPAAAQRPGAGTTGAGVPPANKHRGRALPPQNPPVVNSFGRSQPASGSTSSGAGASSQGGPPPLAPSLQSIIKSSCTVYQQSGTTPDVCSVCQNNVTDASDYTTSPRLVGLQHDRITLKCNHHLHAQCLHALISASTDTTSFRCPECQRSFGIRSGNQPTSGKMAVKVDNSMSLGGYEQFGTIIVTYSFTSGVQDGVSYTAHGFPRVAYFPDSNEGNDIVDLIKVAFKRRLIFTIGDSVTSGAKNCIVWNDIHHKTSTRRGDTYGYPDPGYLDRVTAELKSKGVE